MKYDINNIAKTLDKLFNAGFREEKEISRIKLEDLYKLKNLNMMDTTIIIDLKRAIKDKNLIAFLNGSYSHREEVKK